MKLSELSPLAVLSRNLKMKLAFKVNANVETTLDNNEILVKINNSYLSYKNNLSVKDFNDTTSDDLAKIIMKDYRNFVMNKFFTIY